METKSKDEGQGDGEILPEHMAPWIRNARLYQHLKSIGLFVEAIPFEDDPTKISWIQVSVTMPTRTYAELVDRMVPSSDDGLGRPRAIGLPLQRPEVGDIVTAASGDWENVVDFPTE